MALIGVGARRMRRRFESIGVRVRGIVVRVDVGVPVKLAGFSVTVDFLFAGMPTFRPGSVSIRRRIHAIVRLGAVRVMVQALACTRRQSHFQPAQRIDSVGRKRRLGRL
jgi:hypothetical protein